MKILIVEDEMIIRKGLVTSFDWESYGIKEVRDAKNGKVALEIIASFLPDIVMTDIRMPVMDGLALARELKVEYPFIHVIILSGYQDFEYAQQAIKLGVFEYLIKPVGIEDLGSTMESVTEKLKKEAQLAEEHGRLQMIYDDNVQVICEKWLNGLLNVEGDLTLKELAYGEQLGLKMSGPNYQMLLLEVDEQFLLAEISELEMERAYVVIQEIALVVFPDRYQIITWNRARYEVCVMINLPNVATVEVYNHTMAIIEMVKERLGYTLSIGVSTIIDSVYELHHAYHQAKRALGQKQHPGIGAVYHDDDQNPNINKVISTAISYMEDNYRHQITLEMMAKYSFVSTSYFSKLFKKETGETFVKWLNAYRIMEAKKIIVKNGALPIYVVAENVGIPNYKHFVTIFKSETGQTPSEFKRTLQE